MGSLSSRPKAPGATGAQGALAAMEAEKARHRRAMARLDRTDAVLRFLLLTLAAFFAGVFVMTLWEIAQGTQ